ncbi:hypothetical protein DVH05_026354 [Phytophthora capsici]|nr:hypothetical protein DVH05_026354 [Phytophthora capsici]
MRPTVPASADIIGSENPGRGKRAGYELEPAVPLRFTYKIQAYQTLPLLIAPTSDRQSQKNAKAHRRRKAEAKQIKTLRLG